MPLLSVVVVFTPSTAIVAFLARAPCISLTTPLIEPPKT